MDRNLSLKYDLIVYTCITQNPSTCKQWKASPQPEAAPVMFERGLFLSGNKFYWLSHTHMYCQRWLVNEYRLADAVFRIQATQPFK